MKIKQFYLKAGVGKEFCFNVATRSLLSFDGIQTVKLLLAEGFDASTIYTEPMLSGEQVVEVGPRLNFATAWSSNMVSICQAIGLNDVIRVERSRRYLVPEGKSKKEFIATHHDRMTECHYPKPLITFNTGIKPEKVYEVDMINGGPDALLSIPGISMDERDRKFYYDYFVRKHKRNPTIVEIMDLNNANSEHSRHGFFRGKQIIDGIEMDNTLFEVVAGTLEANSLGSVVAFKDNSSVLEGHDITTLHPQKPGEPSSMQVVDVRYHILMTAETHNFPTGVAPFPGAETGTGGRIRDVQGTGKGGFVMAGTAGYCVANLHIPGYEMSWENIYPCPGDLATARQIEIKASDGASDYGNKFGEPLIQGFTRSFDLRLDNGERWGFLKPIMFTGGIGQIDDRHTEKDAEKKGMIIVQVGGPAYRVGFGGGAASSELQGDLDTTLAFNAVQRGDAEMEQKMNRVIRACNEMGDKTLVDVIHDQGAGGPANVLKELVEKSGGRIEIRNIHVGDPTMSVLEIYVAEYQERNGFLVSPENIEEFQAICKREKVGCEILGEVTGDLRFIVHDEQDDSTPVDLELNEVLGDIPQKTFKDTRIDPQLTSLGLPGDLTVKDALYDVLRLVSVGSKRFLTNKVDRAVTGLVARQQCCGPLQLPLADVAVVAQSHFGLTGGATAIGEQPIKMLVDSAAGARMAVGEAWTNLVWAKIDDPKQVKCSANWMCAPKLPGEGAALFDAAKGMCEAMIATGMAVDGGKDSLSMATKVEGETVKSPRQLVISAYAAMSDIRQVITPDLKEAGNSAFLFINLAPGENRLGGSALAQTQKQIGNESPDMDDPDLMKRAFLVVQDLIAKNLISAGHDRSDGGLITTLLEMAFAGNCGFQVELAGNDPIADLFSEELGLVVECKLTNLSEVCKLFVDVDVDCQIIGKTTQTKRVTVLYNDSYVLWEDMRILRGWGEETSYQLERLQKNPDCADEEKSVSYDRKGPAYKLPFAPQTTSSKILAMSDKPKVAILRDEGSNSDREMTSAFYSAGFEPWDITMSDLLAGRINLDDFRGLAAVGGFSYADVPSAAKGWAATIKLNDKLWAMFKKFYNRPDIFTLGVCNGCQLFGLLGLVPWLDINPEKQPRFVRNISNSFESRWTTVKVPKSPAIMLQGMEDLTFGIHVDHGEGRLYFPDQNIHDEVVAKNLIPLVYVDDDGNATEQYPFNPNGSADGFAGLCSPDGRHLAIMPHPERTFLPWQCHWLPQEMKDLTVSPWMQMFRNAYDWCQK